MNVWVRIPGIWRGLTEGEPRPQVEGETVGSVLHNLAVRYPAMRERLFGPDGELNPYLHVLLNRVEIRTLSGAATPVAEEDEIWLLMALAGG